MELDKNACWDLDKSRLLEHLRSAFQACEDAGISFLYNTEDSTLIAYPKPVYIDSDNCICVYDNKYGKQHKKASDDFTEADPSIFESLGIFDFIAQI